MAGRSAAAWCCLFTEDDHGDGYVDEVTPELAIAVVAAARGQGVGRRILWSSSTTGPARRAWRAMGLSSEQDNLARELYPGSLSGYVEIAPDLIPRTAWSSSLGPGAG